VQIAILPVNNKIEAETNALAQRLKAAGFRVQIFERGQLGKKIVEARAEKIPYLLVYGPRDVEAGTIGLRLRDDTDLGAMPIEDFIQKASAIAAARSMELW
jgi:threonyl-tRNA synthetase